MFSLILYSFVIVNQIECIENKIETTPPEDTTDLKAEKYSLKTNPIVINVDPNGGSKGPEEYNYIIAVPQPSFLR